jgi:hypothetical protein
MADNPTTFMCRLSRNLGASTSWNPKGLSRPVMGLLYFFFTYLVPISLALLAVLRPFCGLRFIQAKYSVVRPALN